MPTGLCWVPHSPQCHLGPSRALCGAVIVEPLQDYWAFKTSDALCTASVRDVLVFRSTCHNPLSMTTATHAGLQPVIIVMALPLLMQTVQKPIMSRGELSHHLLEGSNDVVLIDLSALTSPGTFI